MTVARLFYQSLFSVFVGAGTLITGMHSYNPALWTMKMEFYGSIGLFAVYCLLPAAWARRGLGLAAALVAVGCCWQIELLGPFTFGVALFEVRRIGGMRFACPPYAAAASTVVLLAAGVFLGGMPYDMGPGFYHRLWEI